MRWPATSIVQAARDMSAQLRLRSFLLANASLITIAAMQPCLTAKVLANILSRAYVGLGLSHLNQLTK